MIGTASTLLHRGHQQLVARRWEHPWGDMRTATWPAAAQQSNMRGAHRCNICGWRGHAFGGVPHSESAVCPVCGSVARDRFLAWCWTQRTGYDRAARVLETSPRLNAAYLARMGQRVDYTSSDYDGVSHQGVLKLDLQDIALPDDSLDVVLTPHVLEHVPDTSRALAELHRVLRTGGRAFVQVPITAARTSVPAEPEYHGDDTLVYFRFGWDLADQARAAGFTCATLVTQQFYDAVRLRRPFGYVEPDCDADDMVRGADPAALTVVVDDAQAQRYGFLPAFWFVTFELAV